MSLERIRQLLMGHDIEPDGQNRDIRLFFAVSWGLASSPSICPLMPDELDGQLSQVMPLLRAALVTAMKLMYNYRPPRTTFQNRRPRQATRGSCQGS